MTTIDEAKNMRSGINVEGTVERKEEIRTVNTKAGSTVDVANAMLVDNGMEIKITLWAEDANNIQNGDKIKISVENRSIDLLVDEAELENRRQKLVSNVTTKHNRGYKKLYYETVLQADGGCDFDFLRDPSCLLYTSPSPRDVEESRMPSSA